MTWITVILITSPIRNRNRKHPIPRRGERVLGEPAPLGHTSIYAAYVFCIHDTIALQEDHTIKKLSLHSLLILYKMEINATSDQMVELNSNISSPHIVVLDNNKKPSLKKSRASPISKGHEITVRTIRQPQFAYAYLELICDTENKPPVEIITFRSHLTAAFTQFLGLTGSAMPVDILKVEGRECWIRVPLEDLSTVIAAVTGWLGNVGQEERIAWKVKDSGNWLSSIVGSKGLSTTWGS